MRQVITVSLNGRAYALEDDAHAALGAYLAEASRALAANPDKDEIIADLEQAIADKCDRCLAAHKTVVSRAEIVAIIGEMGPVDGAPPSPVGTADSAAGAAPAGETPRAESAVPPPGGPGPAPRRLYQISEGALISGVCNGLAAYFNLDVTIVRLAFVVLTFLTGGMTVLVYLVLMFVVPYASTSEEHAAARGVPFNARVLVEQAKQKAAQFTQSAEWKADRSAWKREWRRARAEVRHAVREAKAEWRAHRWGAAPPGTPPGPPPSPAPYAAHVLSGLLLAILGLVLAAFTIAWVVALLSLAFTGSILGWWLPHGVSFWIAIVVLIVLYQLVAWPLKAARRAVYGARGVYHAPSVAAWDGIVTLAVLFALGWYAYGHVAGFHDLVEHVRAAFESFADRV